MKLSLWQRLILKLRGHVLIYYTIDDLPFFLVKCPKHGLFTDYKHGRFDEFNCPKCMREKN